MSQPWILIPVHNRRELTLGCLRHLAATGADRGCTILVIDDGSSDGTGASVRSEFPSVKLLKGDGQLWWTGAICAGMIEADRGGATAVLWLNDDCLPEPGSVERLLARATRTPGSIVGAVSVTADGAHPVDTAFVGRTRHSAPAAGADEMNVDGLSGFCVAVPRPVWAAIGFPDAGRFPHYVGDTSYTLSARKAGFAVILSGSARSRLPHYRERAMSIAAFRSRGEMRTGWADVFRSPRSPFRAATQWHYLRLRYGVALGSLLALVRLAAWQLSFVFGSRQRR